MFFDVYLIKKTAVYFLLLAVLFVVFQPSVFRPKKYALFCEQANKFENSPT